MGEYRTVSDIVDSAVRDITWRVAKLELNRKIGGFDESGDTGFLRVAVAGEYRIVLIWQAQFSLLRAIAERMKRGVPEDEEEIAIYLKEYYNILCGHVVTTLNRMMHTSARFGIPDFASKMDSVEAASQPLFELCYESELGNARIRGICEGPELSDRLAALQSLA